MPGRAPWASIRSLGSAAAEGEAGAGVGNTGGERTLLLHIVDM